MANIGDRKRAVASRIIPRFTNLFAFAMNCEPLVRAGTSIRTGAGQNVVRTDTRDRQQADEGELR
jgi:hypothetical protein